MLISTRGSADLVAGTALSEDTQLIGSTYGGVAAFVLMSVVNFTIQAIPVMALLVLYAAILSSYSKSVITFQVPGKLNRAAGVLGLLAGIFLFFNQAEKAQAQILNKNAADTARKGKLTLAESMLKKLEHRLPESESYWVNYGDVLYQLKKYKEAGAALKKAQHFSSNPEHYFVSGSCYEKMGEYLLAESDYRTARFLQPGKFKYRMALMRVYLKVKNHAAAAVVARDIVELGPKVLSPEVSKYKRIAKKY